MRKPVIGVTLSWYKNDQQKTDSFGKWCFGLNQTYAELIAGAGALPVGIIPAGKEYRDILDIIDMVLLTGGGDPDPELYGQKNNGSKNCSRERFIWEIDMYRSARAMGKPVFGICLGMQLIGIAEGVSLIQDIPSQIKGALDHYGKPHIPRKHTIRIMDNTVLHGILGSEAEVSSFHHQGISRMPEGFLLAAQSSDDIIEAIESDDGGVLAVQWHPERDFTGPLILNAMLSRMTVGD
ncbi:MAG: gamma-glutamyl-gamma-aminobutyrate hydrolase family protein [Candidatus Aegiribacteria sp.]|nr:gamma-glutamyl-gamma-aminobutyrate hydrolase family protein [Candidatus Aegiribacteria sp.]